MNFGWQWRVNAGSPVLTNTLILWEGCWWWRRLCIYCRKKVQNLPEPVPHGLNKQASKCWIPWEKNKVVIGPLVFRGLPIQLLSLKINLVFQILKDICSMRISSFLKLGSGNITREKCRKSDPSSFKYNLIYLRLDLDILSFKIPPRYFFMWSLLLSLPLVPRSCVILYHFTYHVVW